VVRFTAEKQLKIKIMKHRVIIEDWKQPEEVIEQLLEVISELGGYTYQLPTCEGSYTYGIIVSKKKLSKKKISKIDKETFE